MSDPAKRVCARMDRSAVQRLGTSSLKALALYTMLTTVGVAAAAQATDTSSSSPVSIRGMIQDRDRPLPDIDVQARLYGGRKEQATKTDERGAYAFENLAPGLYVISFFRSSQQLSSDVAVEVCKGTTVTLDTMPDPGLIGEVVEVSFPPGEIRGAVSPQRLDEKLSGATVTLVRPEDGFRRTTKTNAAWGYKFDGLKPGHYELTGAAKGFVTRSIGFDLTSKPRVESSSPGPKTIEPGDLDGHIALCPREPEKGRSE